MGVDTYDYIVVGGGTAGCVVAANLSEDPDCRVLLMEAGGSDLHPLIQFPVGFFKLPDSYNWWYPGQPDASRDDVREPWPAGRVLGGSSSINANTWTRGHHSDYVNWVNDGCVGWDPDTVKAYYRRIETYSGGADSYRGDRGPQHVTKTRVRHKLTEAFLQAAVEAGINYSPDLNGAQDEGVGYQQVFQRRGLRDSTARSFLAPARHRRNLVVLSRRIAVSVVLERSRAVAVEYMARGQRHVAYADREIILSAGTIGSTKLLLLSGIGPADSLRTVGIEPKVDLPGVGRNLQDHAVVGFTHASRVATLNNELNLPGVVKHGLAFLWYGGGGATMAGSTAVAFARLGDDSVRPDVELTFRPAAAEADPRKSDAKFSSLRPMSIPAVQSNVWLSHPRVRGKIELNSSDPAVAPRISHELLADPADLGDLVRGCKLLRDVFARAPIRRYIKAELSPGEAVVSDDDLLHFVKKHARHGHHPVGTCAMGKGPDAVVDPELRARGIDGLRIIDASVMPTLITGHTNAPTVMIAQKGSDMILGHPGRRAAKASG